MTSVTSTSQYRRNRVAEIRLWDSSIGHSAWKLQRGCKSRDQNLSTCYLGPWWTERQRRAYSWVLWGSNRQNNSRQWRHGWGRKMWKSPLFPAQHELLCPASTNGGINRIFRKLYAVYKTGLSICTTASKFNYKQSVSQQNILLEQIFVYLDLNWGNFFLLP